MPASAALLSSLANVKRCFETTISCLDEADSGFAPSEDVFTVAGHVAHTAQTVDWFVEGVFGDGWDMDFERHLEEVREFTSLADARKYLDDAFARVIAVVGAASDEELASPIPDRRIMAGAPRSAITQGIADHSAHHRGALSVYARLLGKVPPMPYA